MEGYIFYLTLPDCLTLDIDLSPEAREALREAASNIRLGLLSLVIPTALLYFALYALVKKNLKLFRLLDWLAVYTFYLSSAMVVLKCAAIRSLQLFAVAIGVMKALDFYTRINSPPKYAYPNPPSDAVIALLYLTELRYESFTPNFLHTAPGQVQIVEERDEDSLSQSSSSSSSSSAERKTRRRRKFAGSTRRNPIKPSSKDKTDKKDQPPPAKHFFFDLSLPESVDLILHAGVFLILQSFCPQSNPTVIALQVLLAIYVIWETLQLFLRYKSSPPLFGPIYAASSLGYFWSETWHTAFASPCRSLAYDPLRRYLPARYGLPESFAKAIGIIASFSLMGLFHAYALAPLLSFEGVLRISGFFLLNGIGTVIESSVWGKRAHWGKALLAWVFELIIATWTVEGLSVPKGLKNVSWKSVCDVGKDAEMTKIV
ncbi:hypothetical protein FQN57_005519 [Myotisia sp. PD_48]|nr:hypothetical protein FQN57_005519 [Myotisia sp. PD_48]